MEYKVVVVHPPFLSFKTPEAALEEKVNALLQEGWQLAGGVATMPGDGILACWIQALYKTN